MAQVTTLLTRAAGNSIKDAEHDPGLYKVFKAKGLSDA